MLAKDADGTRPAESPSVAAADRTNGQLAACWLRMQTAQGRSYGHCLPRPAPIGTDPVRRTSNQPPGRTKLRPLLTPAGTHRDRPRPAYIEPAARSDEATATAARVTGPCRTKVVGARRRLAPLTDPARAAARVTGPCRTKVVGARRRLAPLTDPARAAARVSALAIPHPNHPRPPPPTPSIRPPPRPGEAPSPSHTLTTRGHRPQRPRSGRHPGPAKRPRHPARST